MCMFVVLNTFPHPNLILIHSVDCLVCCPKFSKMKKCRYQKGSKTSFHRFPINLTERGIWLQNMKTFNWTPKEKDSLCSKHFDDECLIKHSSRTSLKLGSVPTIFENPNSFEALEIGHCGNVSRGKEMDVKKLPVLPDSNSSEELKVADCENVNVKAEMDVEELLPKVFIYPLQYATAPTPESCSLSKYQTSKQSGVKRLISESILEDNGFQKDASTTKEELERDRLLQDSIKNDHFYGACRSSEKSRLKNSVEHDHRYETSLRSSKEAIQCTKRLLKLSNAKVTALTHHVKRLQMKVANLKSVINC